MWVAHLHTSGKSTFAPSQRRGVAEHILTERFFVDILSAIRLNMSVLAPVRSAAALSTSEMPIGRSLSMLQYPPDYLYISREVYCSPEITRRIGYILERRFNYAHHHLVCEPFAIVSQRAHLRRSATGSPFRLLMLHTRNLLRYLEWLAQAPGDFHLPSSYRESLGQSHSSSVSWRCF